MKTLSAQELSSVIDEFLKRSNPTLFAGAGVGVRAGLPTWWQFMNLLAEFAQKYDPDTANLIRKRAGNGHYLEAASVYKTCPDIPEGEKYKGLSAPFQNVKNTNKLQALVSLPFFAIITTNYDRSIHDGYAKVHGKAPHTVELHDSTMANASYRTDFYIARIHGRAEVSKEMVLDNEGYNELLKDENYIDYIISAFTRYSCLFIGFSFVDPAIKHVLNLLEKRLAPDFPSLHLALLPSDAKDDLVTALKRLNIDVKFYESDEQHTALWEAIKLSSQKQALSRTAETENADKKVTTTSLPIDGIKRYIAAAYSHMRISESEGNEFIPLRDIAIDGILIGMLSEHAQDGIESNALINELKRYLHIPEEEASTLFDGRIETLYYRKYVAQVGDRVILSKTPEKNLSAHLSKLVKGAIERLQVREGKKPTAESYDLIEKVIESVLMIRSWDLGAYFAGATYGDIPNVFYTVQEQVERFAATYSPLEKQALIHSISGLFNRPDDQESKLLGDLGRVAFGLQLVTNNPCSILAYSEVLPERIYLDSSVLMPAIVDGHPYSRAYRDAISRLRRATQSAGKNLALWVAKDFLNEVISHRRLAIKEVNELGLFDPNELERHVGFYSAENANIFIAAYSSRVGRTKEKIKFDDFLKEVAPYTNEDQLESFLKAKEGITTARIKFNSENELNRAKEISIELHKAYKHDTKPGYDIKDAVLIDHEANQLAKLVFDLERGVKTMFVTADQRFRRLASDVVPGKLGSAIMSHRGLVQLVDLLLGVKTDPVSFSRLIWGGGYNDQTAAIHDYFTDIALRHYNDAYAMALPDVLSKMTQKVTNSANLQQINFRSKTPSDKAQTVRFMDRFQNEFYADMVDAIRKRSPEDTPDILATRREYLEGKISTIKEQINNLEDLLPQARNKDENQEFKKEIDELNLQLNYFKKHLNNMNT